MESPYRQHFKRQTYSNHGDRTRGICTPDTAGPGYTTPVETVGYQSPLVKTTPVRAVTSSNSPYKQNIRTRDPKQVLQELLSTIKPPSVDSVISRDLDVMQQLSQLRKEHSNEIERICKFKAIQTWYIEQDRSRALSENSDGSLNQESINGLYNNMIHRLLDRVESEISKFSSNITSPSSKKIPAKSLEHLTCSASYKKQEDDNAQKENSISQKNENEVRNRDRTFARKIHKTHCGMQQSAGTQVTPKSETKKLHQMQMRTCSGENDVQDTSKLKRQRTREIKTSIIIVGNASKRAKNTKDVSDKGRNPKTRETAINESERRQIKLWKKQLFQSGGHLDDEEEGTTRQFTSSNISVLHQNALSKRNDIPPDQNLVRAGNSDYVKGNENNTIQSSLSDFPDRVKCMIAMIESKTSERENCSTIRVKTKVNKLMRSKSLCVNPMYQK